MADAEPAVAAMESVEAADEAPAEDAMNWDEDDEETESLKKTGAAQQAYDDALAAEREKNAKRAARFGIPQVEPKPARVMGTKRAAVREGFATGIDLTDQAEAERRRKRAERFGVETLDVRPATMIAEERKETMDEAKKAAERAAKFGIDDNFDPQIMQVDALEARREVDQASESPRDDTNGGYAVHMFGVDSMSTNDITKYFEGYGPSWVEWINDSSCNVAFEDFHSVKRVLHMLAIPPDGDETLVEQNPLVWREAAPFVRRSGEQAPLHLRQATTLDVRPERPNPKSAWARSLQRKQKRLSGGQGRSSKKRRHRDAVPLVDMEEEGQYDEQAGDEDEDRPARKMKLSQEDASRMASMLGRDLRAIISQRNKQPTEDTEMAQEEGADAEGSIMQDEQMETAMEEPMAQPIEASEPAVPEGAEQVAEDDDL